MKTTYLIELAVDEEWFKAISEFTADVQEGELCEWVIIVVIFNIFHNARGIINGKLVPSFLIPKPCSIITI